MTIAAIIPTKNRPNDLLKAVQSLLYQKRLPNQLIIIDQSENKESVELLNGNIKFPNSLKLHYVHNTNIRGLVEAKAASLDYVKSDIVCFFEDDIVLESDYLLHIEKAFFDNPKMLGCSGIITNATSSKFLYRFFYRISHIGIFKDLRPDIYAKLKLNKNLKIQSNVINGGLSAWRFSVFKDAKFDLKNRFYMMEDFEFSTRVDRLFPGTLYIYSAARLQHNYSPLNRANKIRQIELKTFEYVLYYKKNKSINNSITDFLVLIISLLFINILESFKSASLKPLIAFIRGLKLGNQYQLK